MPTKVIQSFLSLMVSAFLLFFIAVGMYEPGVKLIRYMNDQNTTKSVEEWAIFIAGALLSTASWCTIWIWFKLSEKVCVDHFDQRQ